MPGQQKAAPSAQQAVPGKQKAGPSAQQTDPGKQRAVPKLEKAEKPVGVAKLLNLNIIFAKAIVEGFDQWAEGSGTQYKISVYNRSDGKPFRMSIDWDTKGISEKELDQMVAYDKCCSFRINGVPRSANISRFGKRHVRTTFDLPVASPSNVQLINVQLLMRPSPPARRKEVVKQKPKIIPDNITADDYKHMSALIHIAVNRTDYFAQNLYATFKHPRCTTCHLMGSTQAIKNQHSSDGVGQVQGLDVKPDDPAICKSCHHDLKDTAVAQLGNFTDTLWRSPAFAKNINWKTKVDAKDVCTTVVSHLNTKENLLNHFRNDARIAWAVNSGTIKLEVAGGFFGTKPPAPPGTFAGFLERIDRWVALGFPCPQ